MTPDPASDYSGYSARYYIMLTTYEIGMNCERLLDMNDATVNTIPVIVKRISSTAEFMHF